MKYVDSGTALPCRSGCNLFDFLDGLADQFEIHTPLKSGSLTIATDGYV